VGWFAQTSELRVFFIRAVRIPLRRFPLRQIPDGFLRVAMGKAKTTFSPVSPVFLESQSAAELFWWHFALMVPTIGFKYLYVRRMSFTSGLWTIFESMGSGIERYFNLLLLATVDLLEVSIIVGMLFVVGRLLLRLASKTLIFTSVFFCLIIMGTNQYSLLLVANLVTVDTFVISTNWAMEHPYVLWQSVSLPQIGVLILAAVWSSFFAMLPSRAVETRGPLLQFRRCSYSFLLKLILIGSALGSLAFSRMNANFPLVLRGYWSSTFISFFKLDTPKLPMSVLPSLKTIRSDYERLIYPGGIDAGPRWLRTVPTHKLIPRHVLIVTLETAPLKYYPLIDNPALPAFYEMSKHAIVSDHHYAMSPYTWWNNASILSGTYFVQKGKGIFDYGDFETDSIASILARRGYTATFVESSKHGWGKTTGFWNNFGFTNLLDTEDDPIPLDRSSYPVSVDKERQSFARALEAIIDAESRKTKAMVLLATTIGHYPWLAKPGGGGRSSEENLYGIAALFDELLGELLKSLKQHGLHEQVLIVVTGDHGFRMRTEFESVGLKAEHGDVAFNVPFLLYGPGLFEKQIRLPYVTSHVDIAPTLLALMGIHEDSWLHHGGHLLDQRLRDRVTFMMNTNLSPISGFRWKGCHYTLNDLTGRTEVREASRNADFRNSECGRGAAILSDDAVRSMLQAADRQFQLTFAYFKHRRASGAN
jgi:Sulfatase